MHVYFNITMSTYLKEIWVYAAAPTATPGPRRHQRGGYNLTGVAAFSRKSFKSLKLPIPTQLFHAIVNDFSMIFLLSTAAPVPYQSLVGADGMPDAYQMQLRFRGKY
jgi:hypothetical protein